jgi:N-carbamoyl-L-amino-acid hydrolase
VLGGLEAIRTLQRAGYKPVRSIELLLFTSEEPTRFGIGCLGSRLLSGELTAAADTALQDANGNSLQEVRTSAGFSGTLDSVRMPGGYYSAFLELHIEQGPLLEQRGISIGAVTAIAAPSSLRVIIEGQGGHAGGVLMPDRRDAFMAAAEIALALETLARSTGSIDTVATCGVCNVFPGLVNGIPSRVTLELDVRDIDGARRDNLLKNFHNEAAEIAARRGVHIRFEPINQDAPAPCDPALVDAVVRASEKHGISCQRMISRAYHDSLFMTRICPVGMIFIPCRDGVSHRPDEYTWPEAIEHGVTILAAVLARQSAA